MSEIYHWFITSGRSPLSSSGSGIFFSSCSKTTQTDGVTDKALPFMPPICDGWFLTNQHNPSKLFKLLK